MALCAGASQRAAVESLSINRSGMEDPMKELSVDVVVRPKEYRIVIEAGLLNNLALELKRNPLGKRYAIITDTIVNPLYAEPLCRSLREAGIPAQVYAFAHGKPAKRDRQRSGWKIPCWTTDLAATAQS